MQIVTLEMQGGRPFSVLAKQHDARVPRKPIRTLATQHEHVRGYTA